MKPELKELEEYEFLFEGGRETYFYPNYLILKMYTLPHDKYELKTDGCANLKNHQVKWYFALKDYEKFKLDLSKYATDPNLLKEMEEYLTKVTEETVERLSSISYKEIDNKELWGLISYYYDQFVNLLRPAGIIRSIDRGVFSKLKKIFEKHERPDECIAMSSVGERPGFLISEEIEVVELAIKIEENKIKLNSEEFEKGLKELCDKYAWSAKGYYNEPSKTEEDYRKKVEEIIDLGAKKIKSDIEKRIEEDLGKRKELIKSLKKEEIKLVDITAYSTYLKDYFKFLINKITHFAEPIFKEIARRTETTPEFLKDLLPGEIKDLLTGKKIDEKLVEERTKHNVIVSFKGNSYILVGEEADEFEKKYLIVENKNQKEFKGRVASPGLVKGKAKIVLGGKDFDKLNKGDILIVTNTSPDFVTVMKKAAAIVAEEGGLTAHVSVVSREFGIPCVVGVNNITNILKDGDTVEVDANKGIVKILERAK